MGKDVNTINSLVVVNFAAKNVKLANMEKYPANVLFVAEVKFASTNV